VIRPAYKFIERLVRDLSDRASSPSPLGSQLERLRDGTLEIQNNNPFRYEERAQITALRLIIWNQISPVAQRALILRHTPTGWQEYFRQVSVGELVYDTNYDPPIWTTRRGEEIAPEEEAKRHVPDDVRIVRGYKPVFPESKEIAKQVGVSWNTLRRLLSVAYETIENHPLVQEGVV
jgi:hypothetical protein